jgi:hypothetical protein
MKAVKFVPCKEGLLRPIRSRNGHLTYEPLKQLDVQELDKAAVHDTTRGGTN